MELLLIGTVYENIARLEYGLRAHIANERDEIYHFQSAVGDNSFSDDLPQCLIGLNNFRELVNQARQNNDIFNLQDNDWEAIIELRNAIAHGMISVSENGEVWKLTKVRNNRVERRYTFPSDETNQLQGSIINILDILVGRLDVRLLL